MRRTSKSKYKNVKVQYKDMTFDSVKEMDRYIFLCELQKRGVIKNLQRQVMFELLPAHYGTRYRELKTKIKEERYLISKAENYYADFTYTKVDTGEFVVEDVKGFDKRKNKPFVTREFVLKSKIFNIRYGYDITVVTDITSI